MPGPARVVGGLRGGSRDGERVDTGLGVGLLNGLRGAQQRLCLGLLLLLRGSGQGLRHLNHRRRRHSRGAHLTVHEALIHGEGLDEEGLPRRRSDRFGLSRRDRLPEGLRGLSGLGRRVGGHRRVPGLVSCGRIRRLRGGDRCGDLGALGLSGAGLLDLRGLRLGGGLLDEGITSGGRRLRGLGGGVLRGLGSGGLLDVGTGLGRGRLGLLLRGWSEDGGGVGGLAERVALRHLGELGGLGSRRLLGNLGLLNRLGRHRVLISGLGRGRLRDDLGQRVGVEVLAPFHTHAGELAGEDLGAAEVVPDLPGARTQAQGGGVEDGDPAVGQEAQEQPGHLAGGGVPQAHGAVLGAGEDPGAVGAPLRVGDAETVAGQGQDDLAGDLVPHAHDAVVEAGQHLGAVGAPGVGADHGGVVAQRHELAGGDDVPDVGGAVGAAGDDARASLSPHDVAHPVAGVGVDDLAGGGVPDAGRPVLGAGQGALAVGAPGDRGNHVAVALEGQEALAAGGVPDRGAVVPQSGEDALAVRAPGDVVDVVLPGGQGLDDVAGGGIQDEDAGREVGGGGQAGAVRAPDDLAQLPGTVVDREAWLASGGVPDAVAANLGADAEPGAVGAPGDGLHGVTGPQDELGLASGGVPDAHGVIVRAGGHATRVRAPGQGAGPLVVAAQAEQLLAGGGVPDVGGGTGDVVSDDAAAVGAPGDDADPAALAAVEAEDLLAGGGVPDPGLGRVEGGDDATRVRAP